MNKIYNKALTTFLFLSISLGHQMFCVADNLQAGIEPSNASMVDISELKKIKNVKSVFKKDKKDKKENNKQSEQVQETKAKSLNFQETPLDTNTPFSAFEDETIDFTGTPEPTEETRVNNKKEKKAKKSQNLTYSKRKRKILKAKK